MIQYFIWKFRETGSSQALQKSKTFDLILVGVQFGITCTKHAKEFTSAEQGENMSLNWYQNIFWQLMVQMIHAGCSYDSNQRDLDSLWFKFISN